MVSRKASKLGISSEAALIILAKDSGIGTSSFQRKLDPAKQAEIRDALPTIFAQRARLVPASTRRLVVRHFIHAAGRKVLGFRYCARRGPWGTHAAARVHHPSRRRCGGVAACGDCAAGRWNAPHRDFDAVPPKRYRMAIPRWRIATRAAKTGMDARRRLK